MTEHPSKPWAHDDACVCGHSREIHTHYRRGSDCGVCGVKCRKYKPFGLPRRGLLGWLRGLR